MSDPLDLDPIRALPEDHTMQCASTEWGWGDRFAADSGKPCNCAALHIPNLLREVDRLRDVIGRVRVELGTTDSEWRVSHILSEAT